MIVTTFCVRTHTHTHTTQYESNRLTAFMRRLGNNSAQSGKTIPIGAGNSKTFFLFFETSVYIILYRIAQQQQKLYCVFIERRP